MIKTFIKHPKGLLFIDFDEGLALVDTGSTCSMINKDFYENQPIQHEECSKEVKMTFTTSEEAASIVKMIKYPIGNNTTECIINGGKIWQTMQWDDKVPVLLLGANFLKQNDVIIDYGRELIYINEAAVVENI